MSGMATKNEEFGGVSRGAGKIGSLGMVRRNCV